MGQVPCCSLAQSTHDDKANEINDSSHQDEESIKSVVSPEPNGKKKVEQLTKFYGAADCAYTKTMTK